MDNFFTENEVSKDSLTSVYSRQTIFSYASYLISKNIPFSFALIDIDNFSYINDAFGEDGGNKILCNIASKLVSIVGEQGSVARGDGDEFIVILKNMTVYDEIWNICHNILVQVNEIEFPEIESQTLSVTIGLARYPENAKNGDELLECAQKALFRGKSKGRNCFIIYLPEKHASIVPKSEKQKAVGSLNLHSNIFKYLTTPDDLKDGIQNLFNFLSSYFEIDHICIQGNSHEKIFFQKIHQRAKTNSFAYVPHDLITQSMNKLTGVLYISDIKNLLRAKQDKLYEIFQEQKITSSCFCEISWRNENYGLLRFDLTGNGEESRLLQYADIDLFLTAAKTIALILHYSSKKIEDLN